MNKQRLIIAVLTLIALSFAGWYVVDHLEWRDETKHTGYSPEARANPWHAGLLLLRRLEHPAEKAKSAEALKNLPASSTLMLTGLDRFADPEMRIPLLDWVRRGGHLVLPLSAKDTGSELLKALQVKIRASLPGELWNSYTGQNLDFTLEAQAFTANMYSAPVFELGALPTEALQWQSEIRGRLKAKSGQTEFIPLETNPDLHTDLEERIESAQNNATLALYARFRLGQGRVTLGNFTPFSNENIDKLDHAALFMRLMSLPDGPRPVLMMVVPPYPDLFSYLLDSAPEALLVAALLLIASLRRVMPRFGPLLPDAPLARPGLREHLAASGHFLLRQHCFEALLKPLRETVQAQLDALQHRHPEIEGRERLAEHLSNIPTAEVQRALAPEAGNAHEFLRRARTLATVRQRCRLLQHANFPGAES